MSDSLSRLDQFLRDWPAQKIPPVDQWQPEQCGEIAIRIDTDGNWFHEGQPIKRQALVKLFASILRLEEDGYYLVTPAEKQRIEVADAPLFVDQLQHDGVGEAQRLVLTTRTGDCVVIGAEHPLWVEDADTAPRPYVSVRQGLHARIARSVFYQLVELAVEHTWQGRLHLGVWSQGCFLPLDQGRGC